MWKKLRQPGKNNKLKLTAPTQNDEFKLPDSSQLASDIENYIEYIIKEHETLSTKPPTHIYINKINNRLVFNTKDGYKLELQTPETMK